MAKTSGSGALYNNTARVGDGSDVGEVSRADEGKRWRVVSQ
jgi:hypothetical protein